MGFPILRDLPVDGGAVRELTPQEVKDLSTFVLDLNRSLVSPAIANYPSDPITNLGTRLKRVSNLLPVLIDTNNNDLASFTVKVDPTDKENLPILRRFQGIAVSTNESARAEWINTSVSFGPFYVDQPLVIVSKKISDLPPAPLQPAVGTHRIKAWAALRMMCDTTKYQPKPDLGDAERKTWTVKVPAEDGGSGFIKLILVFKQKGPDLNDWPSKNN